MKHFFYILFCLTFVSCTSLSKTNPLIDGNVVEGTYITMEEARATVEKMLAIMPGQTKGGTKHIEESYLVTQALSRAIPEFPGDTIPPYYVFNFSDNEGYVLASADRRMCPILCHMESGHFSLDSILTNPGQVALLSRIETDYRRAVGIPFKDANGRIVFPEESAPHFPLRLERSEGESGGGYWASGSGIVSYGSILPTRWHQHAPFNAQIYQNTGHDYYAGCTNIALAQIMNASGRNITISGYYVDWSIVSEVIDSTQLGSGIGLGMLQNYLYLAAVALNADFTPNGTFIGTSQIPSYLHSHGYASGGIKSPFDANTMIDDLSEDYPVLGEGYALRDVYYVLGIPIYIRNNGHTWVYDKAKVFTAWEVWIDDTGVPDYSTMSVSQYTIVHCNMGWGGSSDGYYYVGRIDTNHPLTRTEGTPGYYQYELSMITGIRAY